ncbi:MAG: YdjY domain-containing protein [Planctomycetota bacterium]
MHRAMIAAAACTMFAGCVAGCASRSDSDGATASIARPTVEVFPGVRAEPDGGVVEFDGYVPIDCHNPETPDVYLEVIVCAEDSREHESLVATALKPSHLHAAMLLAGFEPGAPGGWQTVGDSIESVLPTGDAVRVMLVVDGQWSTPTEWITNVEPGGTAFADAYSQSSWVFAGSRPVDRGPIRYDADGTGQIIGLHTFGSEVVAFENVLSPEASIEAPEWIADARTVPVRGTPVTVVLTRQ